MRVLLALFLILPGTLQAQNLASDAVSESVLLIPEAETLGLGDVLEQGGTVTIWVPAEAISVQGPHGRAAWRGAKVGALVGLGISAVLLTAAVIDAANGGCIDALPFCYLHVAAVGVIPITLGGAAVGAGVGWVASYVRPIELRGDE